MTGQPSTWDPRRPQGAGGHPKQHDFVFFDVPGAKPLQVTRAAFRDFEFVHGKGQEKHSVNQRIDPNVEWGFWRPFFDAGERVPVFFLVEDDGSLRAFGLAMMFRLTYRHTVGELVRAGQPGQGGDEGARPDLAELLFGHVPLGRSTEGAEEARKGRVSVGLGRLVAGGSEQEARTILLGAPKASFYPAYIEQSDDGPGRDAPSKDRYRTYMDDAGGVPSSRIRGHKRYRIQPSVMPGPPLPRRSNGTVNVGVGTTFSPLGAGTRFRARIRVHNVSRAELGALLWAVDFGSSTEARHAVGMARSLGYGRCRLTVVAHDLRWNDLDRAPDPAVLDGARRDYEQMMEGFCRTAGVEGGWRHGRRLQELVELAKPVPEDSPHREHLRLKAQGEGHRTVNEFVEAKKQGAALPPALSDAEWVDRARRAGVSLRQNQPAGSREPRPPEPGRKPVVIAHSPRGGQPAPTRSPMAPPRTGEWEGLKGGTLVRVELLGLTRKGKWRGRLVGEHAVPGVDARGVLGAGQPPTDAAEGMVVSAVVTAGGDHTNLGLKWL